MVQSLLLTKHINMKTVIVNFIENIGLLYILFIFTLLVTNSLIRYYLGEKWTKNYVLYISLIVGLGFWLAGGGVLKLLISTFASFGFYDFIGKYVEQWLYKWISKGNEVLGE